MTVRHTFLWNVKEGHDADSVVEKLTALSVAVPGVLNWTIGKHEGGTPNSSAGDQWQYGMTVDAPNLESLSAWQQDPELVLIVKELGQSYDGWVSVDYTID